VAPIAGEQVCAKVPYPIRWSSEFLTYNFELIQYNIGLTFPVYEELKTTLENGNDTLVDGQNPLDVPTLALYGSGDIPIIDTNAIDDYIPQIKTWVSVFLWFYAGIFIFKTIYQLFHPGQIKMDL